MSSTPTVTFNSPSTLDIKNVFLRYIPAGQILTLDLVNLVNPPTTTTTSSFKIYTFDNQGSGIDSLISGLTVTA